MTFTGARPEAAPVGPRPQDPALHLGNSPTIGYRAKLAELRATEPLARQVESVT